MKQSVKRALDTLEALDFRLDHDDRKLRHDRWVFTHPNADQRLIVNFRMSEAAASKIIRHAEAIVGLATTESDAAQRKSDRVAAEKKRAAAEEALRREALERIAAAKEARAREARARQFLARQDRGRLTFEDRLSVLDDIKAPHLDATRIADELCLRLPDVQAAINTGALEARVHPGKRVLCDVPEVRRWVQAGCPKDDPLAS